MLIRTLLKDPLGRSDSARFLQIQASAVVSLDLANETALGGDKATQTCTPLARVAASRSGRSIRRAFKRR